MSQKEYVLKKYAKEYDLGEIDLEDYLVLTDEEATEEAKNRILESIWAFRPSFLAAHLKDGIDQEVVETIQANGRCEDNNKAILSLIEDVDHLVDDAIRCDGRGHFLSGYDGEENEVNYGRKTYFIYREN